MSNYESLKDSPFAIDRFVYRQRWRIAITTVIVAAIATGAKIASFDRKHCELIPTDNYSNFGFSEATIKHCRITDSINMNILLEGTEMHTGRSLSGVNFLFGHSYYQARWPKGSWFHIPETKVRGLPLVQKRYLKPHP